MSDRRISAKRRELAAVQKQLAECQTNAGKPFLAQAVAKVARELAALEGMSAGGHSLFNLNEKERLQNGSKP